ASVMQRQNQRLGYYGTWRKWHNLHACKLIKTHSVRYNVKSEPEHPRKRPICSFIGSDILVRSSCRKSLVYRTIYECSLFKPYRKASTEFLYLISNFSQLVAHTPELFSFPFH